MALFDALYSSPLFERLREIFQGPGTQAPAETSPPGDQRQLLDPREAHQQELNRLAAATTTSFDPPAMVLPPGGRNALKEPVATPLPGAPVPALRVPVSSEEGDFR